MTKTKFEEIVSKCKEYIKKYPELKIYTVGSTVQKKFRDCKINFDWCAYDPAVWIYKEKTGVIEMRYGNYYDEPITDYYIVTKFGNTKHENSYRSGFNDIKTMIDVLHKRKPVSDANLAYAEKYREKRAAEKWVINSMLDEVTLPGYIIKYDAELEKQGVHASIQNPGTDIRIKMRIWISDGDTYNGVKYISGVVLDYNKKQLLSKGKPLTAINQKNVVDDVLLKLKNGKFEEY